MNKICQKDKWQSIFITIENIAAILTLSESVHKWKNGVVKVLRNPITADEIQPPIGISIFVNNKFPIEHKIILRGRKVNT